jgi:hypothetical protein
MDSNSIGGANAVLAGQGRGVLFARSFAPLGPYGIATKKPLFDLAEHQGLIYIRLHAQ